MRAILKDRYGFIKSDMAVQSPPPNEIRIARTTLPSGLYTDGVPVSSELSEYQHAVFRLVRIAKSAYANSDTAIYEEYDIEMQSKARAQPTGIQPPVEYKKRMMK